MSKHAFRPPFDARSITPTQMELIEPGRRPLVTTRAEAIAYAHRILDAAEGPGPDVVCELIPREQVRL